MRTQASLLTRILTVAVAALPASAGLANAIALSVTEIEPLGLAPTVAPAAIEASVDDSAGLVDSYPVSERELPSPPAWQPGRTTIGLWVIAKDPETTSLMSSPPPTAAP